MSNETQLAMLELVAAITQQARDEGLWFEAMTAPEAYLQQELRKLHDVAERVIVALAREVVARGA